MELTRIIKRLKTPDPLLSKDDVERYKKKLFLRVYPQWPLFISFPTKPGDVNMDDVVMDTKTYENMIHLKWSLTNPDDCLRTYHFYITDSLKSRAQLKRQTLNKNVCISSDHYLAVNSHQRACISQKERFYVYLHTIWVDDHKKLINPV